MEYYDPIDRTSRRIATIATAIFMVVVVLGISLIRFSLEVAEREPSLDIIFEELIEEPEAEDGEEELDEDIDEDIDEDLDEELDEEDDDDFVYDEEEVAEEYGSDFYGDDADE